MQMTRLVAMVGALLLMLHTAAASPSYVHMISKERGLLLTDLQRNEFLRYVESIFGTTTLRYKRYFFMRAVMCKSCKSAVLSFLARDTSATISIGLACSYVAKSVRNETPGKRIVEDRSCAMDAMSFASTEGFCVLVEKNNRIRVVPIDPSTIEHLVSR